MGSVFSYCRDSNPPADQTMSIDPPPDHPMSINQQSWVAISSHVPTRAALRFACYAFGYSIIASAIIAVSISMMSKHSFGNVAKQAYLI